MPQGSPGEMCRWAGDQGPGLRGVVWGREGQGTTGIRWALKPPGEARGGRRGEPSERSRGGVEGGWGQGLSRNHQGGGREAGWHKTQRVGKCFSCAKGWCEVKEG